MLWLCPSSKGIEKRRQPWRRVWPGTRSQEASQRESSLSQVWRKEKLAGGEVFLNIPKYAGFHNRDGASSVLWWRLKSVIKTQGLLWATRLPELTLEGWKNTGFRHVFTVFVCLVFSFPFTGISWCLTSNYHLSEDVKTPGKQIWKIHRLIRMLCRYLVTLNVQESWARSRQTKE